MSLTKFSPTPTAASESRDAGSAKFTQVVQVHEKQAPPGSRPGRLSQNSVAQRVVGTRTPPGKRNTAERMAARQAVLVLVLVLSRLATVLVLVIETTTGQ